MLESRFIQLWRFFEKRAGARNSTAFNLRLHGYAVRFLRSFWSAFGSNSDGFSRSLYGVFLKDRNDDTTYRFCRNGSYGIFLLESLESIEHDSIFLDIGGNIGLFSLVAQKNSKIKAIHVFEPDPLTLPFLYSNIEFNKASRIKVHPYALSNSSGPRTLYSTHLHSGVSSLHVKVDNKGPLTEVDCVASSYLDANLPVPDGSRVFVKIDVEGHELFALESLWAWRHASAIDKIFIEFDTKMSDVRKLTEVLQAHGFLEAQRSGPSHHWDALWSR